MTFNLTACKLTEDRSVTEGLYDERLALINILRKYIFKKNILKKLAPVLTIISGFDPQFLFLFSPSPWETWVLSNV